MADTARPGRETAASSAHPRGEKHDDDALPLLPLRLVRRGRFTTLEYERELTVVAATPPGRVETDLRDDQGVLRTVATPTVGVTTSRRKVTDWVDAEVGAGPATVKLMEMFHELWRKAALLRKERDAAVTDNEILRAELEGRRGKISKERREKGGRLAQEDHGE